MEEPLIINFLESFFNLFNARIEGYKIINEKIFGIVGWLNEEEQQDFIFKENFESSLLPIMKLLCDFIIENKLLEGDKIIVSEIELIQELKNQKWNEIDAEKAINGLCNFEVKMLDEGEETDSFYIHF